MTVRNDAPEQLVLDLMRKENQVVSFSTLRQHWANAGRHLGDLRDALRISVERRQVRARTGAAGLEFVLID